MSNRNSLCDPKKFSTPINRSQISMNDPNRYRLPAIQQTSTPIGSKLSAFKTPTTTQSFATPKKEISSIQPTSNLNQMKCDPTGPALRNASMPSYQNCKTNSNPCGPTIPGLYNHLQQTPVNRGWSSNEFVGFGKRNLFNANTNKNATMNDNSNCPPRSTMPNSNGFPSSTSKMNVSNGQKLVCRDRQLANEILQKAGISSNLPADDALEVISDEPVGTIDTVNCDPNPVCMRKPAEHQECYEQSIVVRHLHPPRPAVPAPIIIRERCTEPPAPPQPPIVVRQIPARPGTPPPLIIRQCPPPMPDASEPTIIDREVPAPPPPPRQVIFERLPTPAAKPRKIIFEKWLPYEEPEDRPCIVEKATNSDLPAPKNMIIQYEPAETKVQPQCIDEGISYVDPKQFVQEKPSGNAEICYVDQLNNLPDHIKCQLGPQALAAIGLRDENQSNLVRTNPPATYQQQQQQQNRVVFETNNPMLSKRASMTNRCQSGKTSNGNQSYIGQQSMNRALSTSTNCLSSSNDKYNSNILTQAGHQGLMNLTRAHYNPWATTYQVSYNNRTRSMGRAR